MQTVFVITIDEVFDFETFGHPIEAYEKEADARARYEGIVEDAKREFAEHGWEESEGISYFETYPDGAWGTNHYGVYLNRVEVK